MKKLDFKFFKTTIDVNSIFHKKPLKLDDLFGVYEITGKMGTGKTYASVYMLYRYASNLKSELTVYTNIHSLKNVPNCKFIYFNKMSEIYDNYEENCYFIIDEISKLYSKDCKIDKDFYCWLQHSRKTKRIVFLITQEYLNTPLWLRGSFDKVYTTHKLLFLPLFKTDIGYPVLNENLEWTIDIQSSYIYKRNKFITEFYDTFESVPVL